MKKFLSKFIVSRNTIISDVYKSYIFLSQFNGYIYEVHNHGAGDFGEGMKATSFIESLCNSLKSQIKKLII